MYNPFQGLFGRKREEGKGRLSPEKEAMESFTSTASAYQDRLNGKGEAPVLFPNRPREAAREQVQTAREEKPIDPFDAMDQPASPTDGTWSHTAELQAARMEKQAADLNAALERAQETEGGEQKQA